MSKYLVCPHCYEITELEDDALLGIEYECDSCNGIIPATGMGDVFNTIDEAIQVADELQEIH